MCLLQTFATVKCSPQQIFSAENNRPCKCSRMEEACLCGWLLLTPLHSLCANYDISHRVLEETAHCGFLVYRRVEEGVKNKERQGIPLAKTGGSILIPSLLLFLELGFLCTGCCKISLNPYHKNGITFLNVCLLFTVRITTFKKTKKNILFSLPHPVNHAGWWCAWSAKAATKYFFLPPQNYRFGLRLCKTGLQKRCTAALLKGVWGVEK